MNLSNLTRTTVRMITAVQGRSYGGHKVASSKSQLEMGKYDPSAHHGPEMISIPRLGRLSPWVGNHAAHAVR